MRKMEKAYLDLDSQEKEVLQLASILHQAVNQATMLRCVQRYGRESALGNSPTHADITRVVGKLCRLKLLNKNGQLYQCSASVAGFATARAAEEGRLGTLSDAVQEAIPGSRWDTYRGYELVFRDYRIAIYLQDFNQAARLEKDLIKDTSELGPPPTAILFKEIDKEDFQTWPADFRLKILTDVLQDGLNRLAPTEKAYSVLKNFCADPEAPPEARGLIGEQLFLHGEWKEAHEMAAGLDHSSILALRASIAFLKGENAIELYRSALKQRRQELGTRKKSVALGGFHDVLFVLALLSGKESGDAKMARELCEMVIKMDHPLKASLLQLERYMDFQRTGPLSKGMAFAHLSRSDQGALDQFFRTLTSHWANAQNKKMRRNVLRKLGVRAKSCGYKWLEGEIAELIAPGNPRENLAETEATAEPQKLAHLFRAKDPWEHALDALIGLGHDQASASSSARDGATERMVWLLEVSNGWCSLEPREQKCNKNRVWTKGRKVALKHLHGKINGFSYLTPADRTLCECIEYEYTRNAYGYGEENYNFNYDRAMDALIGHSHVFWARNPEVRVEVVGGKPELLVCEKDGRFEIRMEPPIFGKESPLVTKETPTRVKVVVFSGEHERIAKVLGKRGLSVPAEAKEKVLQAIAAATPSITVQSAVGLGSSDAKEVAPDQRPHLHLSPFGQGLKAAILFRPLPKGAYYQPGMGGETVIAQVAGTRLQTTRDLELEISRAQAVQKACPALAPLNKEKGEWTLADPEACLEFLLDVKKLDKDIVVEWPKGETFKVSQVASYHQFKMQIKRQRDWFSVTGELKLDRDTVLDMRQLLDHLDKSPGRFVALGDGAFVALTMAFRKRLDELRAYSEAHERGRRFHPLVALSLEELLEEAGQVKADKHWKQHLENARAARGFKPRIPSTLRADLRDYQVDGFRWLARLAHWGVGACLADDMGLGKTLQALALLLDRAKDGPALVVAPTSVCMNWESEVRKFAPTLNVKMFGDTDRKRALNKLKAFDLMICSYGLLYQESDALAKVKWRTVVLDEAQAIKNFATKRSKAAMALQGDVKLILTGTPIENHLGELWNQFRFINPGLLGSLESFNRRFAVPIERDGDAGRGGSSRNSFSLSSCGAPKARSWMNSRPEPRSNCMWK